jgi:hypothetical protein
MIFQRYPRSGFECATPADRMTPSIRLVDGARWRLVIGALLLMLLGGLAYTGGVVTGSTGRQVLPVDSARH